MKKSHLSVVKPAELNQVKVLVAEDIPKKDYLAPFKALYDFTAVLSFWACIYDTMLDFELPPAPVLFMSFTSCCLLFNYWVTGNITPVQKAVLRTFNFVLIIIFLAWTL